MDSPLTWITTVAVAATGAIGTGYARLTQNDRDHNSRIAVLEAHRADDTAKLDHIQAQVDKLVEWWVEKN